MHFAASALKRSLLGGLVVHQTVTFRTSGYLSSLLGLFGEKFIHDQSRDSIDLVDGPIFDGHQAGIGQIFQAAFLDQPLNDEAGDFFRGWC